MISFAVKTDPLYVLSPSPRDDGDGDEKISLA